MLSYELWYERSWDFKTKRGKKNASKIERKRVPKKYYSLTSWFKLKVAVSHHRSTTPILNGHLLQDSFKIPKVCPTLLQETRKTHTQSLSAMADKQEQSEMKSEIPVFTVLKNNSILKNIYLLDNPPSIPSSSPVEFNRSKYGKESTKEETLFVGRHPDCNITLEHPSISRFHLRVHSNPSSHYLSVIDLNSGIISLLFLVCVYTCFEIFIRYFFGIGSWIVRFWFLLPCACNRTSRWYYFDLGSSSLQSLSFLVFIFCSSQWN